MRSEFTSIAHAVQRDLKSSGFSARLGHVHELLAACMGYRSFAAYSANADERNALTKATHVVFHEPLLHERGCLLGYGDPALQAFTKAATTMLYRAGEHPHTACRSGYRSLDDLHLSLYPFIWMELPLQDRFVVEAGRLGGHFADADIHFVPPAMCIAEADPEWLGLVRGKVYLEDNAGDPLWTGLEFEADVRFRKVSRVCLSHPTLGILNMRATGLEQLRTEGASEFDFIAEAGH